MNLGSGGELGGRSKLGLLGPSTHQGGRHLLEARRGLRAADANKEQQRAADFDIETRPSGTKHL